MIARVLGLAVFLLLAAHRASGPPRQPSNFRMPPPGRGLLIRTQERVLDLASAAQTSTQEVEAVHLVALRVRSRAPGVHYRVRLERHSSSGEPPRVEEIDLPAEDPTLPDAPPRCQALRAGLGGLLGARDEAEVAARVQALQQLLPAGSCGVLEERAKAALARSDFVLPRKTNLSFTQEWQVTVERFDSPGGPSSRSWHARIVVSQPERHWAYASESQWLVGEIGHDLVEMALYARDRAVPDEETLAYRVSAVPETARPSFRLTFVVDGQPADPPVVEFRDYLWSPADWAPLARWLLQGNDQPPAASDPDGQSAVAALTDPRSVVIEAENQRVSAWLAGHMLDAEAHEQAALVLAALALREASGRLNDLRPTLSRMTAHLAMARALRPRPGAHGRYAEAALLTLCGRERHAVARLAAAPPGSPAERSWDRALRARITRDWRPLSGAKDATLLERLQQFRALKASLGGAYALESITEDDLGAGGDWGAVASWDPNTLRERASVAEGNMLAASSLAATLDEARRVLSTARGAALDEQGFVAALDEVGGRCLRRHEVLPTPLVIGAGDWAQFFQRRILHLLAANRDHLDNVLGQHETAERFATETMANFGKLSLYPVVHPLYYRSRRDARADFWGAATEEACAAAGRLVARRPNDVPLRSWSELGIQCSRERDNGTIPRPVAWYTEPLPYGTAYDAANRLNLGSPWSDAPERARSVRELAPYEPQLAFITLRDKPTPEYVARTLKPFLDHSLPAMRVEAGHARQRPERHRRLLQRMCDLDADSCLSLASHLQQHGRDEAATAAAFERAVAHAQDRVALSNSTNWLVDYYFDRGDDDRAMALATMAATVGSGGGLATMGRVLERLGRYDEAEACYVRVKEAYRRDAPLNEFYLRFEHRVGTGRFTAQAARAREQLFPRGLQRVTASTFAGQQGRAEGMPLRGDVLDWRYERLGLRPGDHIVALDGYRVQNDAQWDGVVGFTDDPQMSVLVWRDGRYVEVKGPFKRLAYGPRRAR